MTRFLLIGSAIGLTFLSSVALAGGGVRDHRHGGSHFGDAPGGVRVYHGHRPAPGYKDPHISPAPAGGYGSGATVRDHRGSTVRDHRSPYGGATVRDHRGLSSPLVKGPFF